MPKSSKATDNLPYDFFPISYWVGPPRDCDQDTAYKEIAECNFTLAHGGNIELAHKYGMKCLVHDGRVIEAFQAPGLGTDAGLVAAVKDYEKHPAFFGFFIKDEPNSKEFPALAHVNKRLLSLNPKCVPYINLFPTYATQQQLGNNTYEEHVEQFMRTVRPRILSYDHYALGKTKDRPDYFLNMEIIRAKALKYNVPWWFILLSTPHWGYRKPTEGDLRWQVYTALAYGAKGIMYFTYWTHVEKDWGDGIIRADGTRTERYDIVKRINSEIKTLGPTLLKLTSKKVYHTAKDLPQGARHADASAWVQEVEGGDLVVGEFKDARDATYLFLVNADMRKSANVSVVLKSKVRKLTEVPKSAGDVVPRPIKLTPHGKTVSFSRRLGAGDGKLFLLEP